MTTKMRGRGIFGLWGNHEKRIRGVQDSRYQTITYITLDSEVGVKQCKTAGVTARSGLVTRMGRSYELIAGMLDMGHSPEYW